MSQVLIFESDVFFHIAYNVLQLNEVADYTSKLNLKNRIMNTVKTSLDAQNQPSCLAAVMPSIYSMKLHEVIALTPTSIEGTAVSYFSIMRVAGGWIYQTWDTEKQDYIRETFVPFNNEFMSV
jgi:hypothetical protein